MKLSLFIASLMIITGCSTVPPVVTPTPPPVVVPTPKPPVVAPKPPVSLAAIAADSACANYSWKNRGRAKVGYIKGMALSYSRSLCRLSSVNDTPSRVMAQGLGDPAKDALAHYGLNGASERVRMKQLYTMLIGLGMREASGFYGEGRDMSADNVQVETAESGLFQFSYNLNSASPALQVLFNEYRNNPERCLLDVFKEGTTRVPSTNFYGSGVGLEFQKLARSCPAFATEYTAVGARVRRAHWGPINRKEAEYRQECENMLTDIEKATVCTM